MIIGTCHFVDRRAAYRYYRKQLCLKGNPLRLEVERLLREKQIAIGPPACREDETIHTNDENRYIRIIHGH